MVRGWHVVVVAMEVVAAARVARTAPRLVALLEIVAKAVTRAPLRRIITAAVIMVNIVMVVKR